MKLSVSVEAAIAEVPLQAERLFVEARQRRQAAAPQGGSTAQQLGQFSCEAVWSARDGCHRYHSHIAIADQPREALLATAELFYGAAALERQPWYEEFLGGAVSELALPCGPDTIKHQLSTACFEMGLGLPRHYRQLLSLVSEDEHSLALVARSVNEGPAAPMKSVEAYTFGCNGEVFYWADNCLHWHHICTTPGASLLPMPLDRWLLTALRACGLDSRERDTYRREAEGLAAFLA